MRPYADSNFFTRLYLPIARSPIAETLLEAARRASGPPLPITWLHRLEIVNALQLHLFTSRMRGQVHITPEQAALAQASFRHDLARPNFFRATRLDEETLATKFEEVSLRHTARHGFRVYDVIHVASALLLGCDTFWSFDLKASRLAEMEGLTLAD